MSTPAIEIVASVLVPAPVLCLPTTLPPTSRNCRLSFAFVAFHALTMVAVPWVTSATSAYSSPSAL